MNVPTCGLAPTTAAPEAADSTGASGAGDLFASLVAGLTATPPGSVATAEPTEGTTHRTADADADADSDGDSGGDSGGTAPAAPPALTALLAAAAQAGALGIVPTGGPATPVAAPAAGTPATDEAAATGPVGATAPDAAPSPTPSSTRSASGPTSPDGGQDAAPRTPASPSTQGPLAAPGTPQRSARATAVLTARFGDGTATSASMTAGSVPITPTPDPLPAGASPTASPGDAGASGSATGVASDTAAAAAASPPPGTAAPAPASAAATVATAALPISARTGAASTSAGPETEPRRDERDHPAASPAPGTTAVQQPELGGTLLTTRGVTTADSTVVTVGRQVAQAVGDNVARLVSRGGGTHRLTLQLQPAALGDVKVVLTVRAGQVHVSLAAGEAARAALLRDSPELHQLLTRAGADQPQIVVRELPAAAGPLPTASAQPAGTPTDQSGAGPATGQPTSGHEGAQLGPDTGGQSQERRAWTPAATSARDGGQRGTGRTDPDRPIDPGTRVRTAGVDVTM